MNTYADGGSQANNPVPKPRSCHSLHFVCDFVDVDATVVGFLLVITIPALREGEGGKKGIPDGTGREGRVFPRGDD